jgi:hypothetical protein
MSYSLNKTLVKEEAMHVKALPEGGDSAFFLGVTNIFNGDGHRWEAEVDASSAALLERVDDLPPQQPDLAPLPPLILRVAIAQRYLDVLRMNHCTY